MSKYIIVAETGSDVSAEIAAAYNIYLVPMHVNFDEETKDDGSFPTTELFDYYKKTKHLPKSAASNTYDFNVMFDRIHEEHPDSHILYMAYSSATTSSYASALLAMEGRDYITAFDTKHVSAGQCCVIMMVARYIEKHPEADIEEILAQAEYYSSHTRMGFFPGDLDYLRAGGRVTNAAYLGAKILSLTPLIEVNDGILVATSKYRGKMSRIAPKLLADFTEKHHLQKDTLIFVYSAGLSEEIKEDVVSQAKAFGYKEILWIQTGCVVSTHSGPGAFGVVGLAE